MKIKKYFTFTFSLSIAMVPHDHEENPEMRNTEENIQ